jgi:hypothetical protein
MKAGITLIAIGVLFGGGLIAGGAVLFARVAPMPIHTGSSQLYRIAYGLTATGIFALGSLGCVGGIFLYDHYKGIQRVKQGERELSQQTERTISISMLDGYLRREPQIHFDVGAFLDNISRESPQLKKLTFHSNFYTVREQVVSHLPTTVEELDLPVKSRTHDDLMKVFDTICGRLPALKTCTLRMSKESLTEDILKSLCSRAFDNNSNMERLVLCFDCGLDHPPIPINTLENHLGPGFAVALNTTRPDPNYVTHRYTITKPR